MTTATLARILDLEVAFNVRHLGGYQGANGLTADDIVRGATLKHLTPAGAQALASRGVRTVVDFRSGQERENDPTPNLGAYGIDIVAAAVFEQDASPVGNGENAFPGFAAVYERFLDNGGGAYRVLCEVIAGSDGGVLFHCAAGKDRTGVAAALLLELAGVADETIVEDYTVTEGQLEPLRSEWAPRMAERNIPPERINDLLAAPAEAMRETLGYLRRRWGSAEGYLHAKGVSPTVVSAVRARMVRG